MLQTMLAAIVACVLTSFSAGGRAYAHFTEEQVQQAVLEHALEHFYEKHSPSKMHLITKALQNFKGREEKLIASLEAKYNDRVDLEAAQASIHIRRSQIGNMSTVRCSEITIENPTYQVRTMLAAETHT